MTAPVCIGSALDESKVLMSAVAVFVKPVSFIVLFVRNPLRPLISKVMICAAIPAMKNFRFPPYPLATIRNWKSC